MPSSPCTIACTAAGGRTPRADRPLRSGRCGFRQSRLGCGDTFQIPYSGILTPTRTFLRIKGPLELHMVLKDAIRAG